MTLYTFQFLECQHILSKDICLNSISAIDNSIILSINSISYKLYQGNEYYISNIYFLLKNIDELNSNISIEISECQQGYKMVDDICIRYISTPIGNLTEGEVYTLMIGMPVIIGMFSLFKPVSK